MSHVPGRFVGLCLLAAVALTGRWVLAAQTPGGPAGLLPAADALMAELRYREALSLYRGARQADDVRARIRGGAGAVRALLRLGLFGEAQREGASVVEADSQQAGAQAVDGDALWAAGLFPEAEDRYAAALVLDPQDPRALHGRGRSLAARQRPDEALADISRAASAEPGEPMYRYSLGMVYDGLRRYDEAADALTQYADMLSRRDVEWATAARARATFLRSFGTRPPIEIASGDGAVYTVPFKMVRDRMVVKGRINGQNVDLVVDTGAEHAVLSPDFAKKAHVDGIARLDTAGVGDITFGIRGMQIARIDRLDVGSLRVNNVTCLIASPALKDMPWAETESISPLALGLSMVIDYRRGLLTMARNLPEQPYEASLPLRMSPLAIIRGVINGTSPVSFVLDTGTEITSLSRSVAMQVKTDPAARLVPVQVYGRVGWDRSAYLLPYVDIDLSQGVGLRQTSVVVLGLDAPSALLGFQVGGIIGHGFLSRYTVTIDLQRSLVGLRRP